jgi:molybdopterin converting factor small subunit
MTLAAHSAGDQAESGRAADQRPASITLLLFAAARVAAGTGREQMEGGTVADVLHGAAARFGPDFAAVLEGSRVWVNGEPVPPDQPLTDGDEVAVLPPVSGGAVATRPSRRPPAARQPVERSPRRPAPAPRSPAAKKRRARQLAAGYPVPRPLVSSGLGLLWAALLVVAAEVGSAALALVFIPVAVIASVSSTRAVHEDRQKARRAKKSSSKKSKSRAQPPPAVELAVAAGVAVVLPLAAIGGGVAALVTGLVLAVAAAGALLLVSPGRVPVRVLLAVFIPSVAAASAVVARSQGFSEGLTLLIAICLFDMANFVTGSGQRGGPVGAIFGALTLAALAVLVSAVWVPPFSGHSAWVLVGLVAVLAPAGVYLASAVAGRPLPALRRLDSLVLAGPAWVIGVGLLLHR